MTFSEAIHACLSKFATFDGRASRPEFWWFFLFQILLVAGASVLSDKAADLLSLAFLLPALAVGSRRLHDTGRSAWWLLLLLLPVVGWILLAVWYALPGQGGSNPYGDAVA